MSYAQEKTPESQEPIKQVKKVEKIKAVPFATVEQVPVYRGCDETLSNKKLKKCMSDKISSHVLKYFNKRVASSLNLPNGKVRINVLFKIDGTGKVGNILVRAPHPKLEAEARRVISKIPDMAKPGMQDGKIVVVPYSLPILFTVDKRSKKQRKYN